MHALAQSGGDPWSGRGQILCVPFDLTPWPPTYDPSSPLTPTSWRSIAPSSLDGESHS